MENHASIEQKFLFVIWGHIVYSTLTIGDSDDENVRKESKLNKLVSIITL
jgi:hypothetical protein